MNHKEVSEQLKVLADVADETRFPPEVGEFLRNYENAPVELPLHETKNWTIYLMNGSITFGGYVEASAVQPRENDFDDMEVLVRFRAWRGSLHSPQGVIV